MRKRRRRRRFNQALCDSPGPDDGLGRLEWNANERRPVRNRKALQLCHQVARTLSLALAECADPVLNGLRIRAVRPYPDSVRLLVLVESADRPDAKLTEVMERLDRATAWLRQEVAAGIHRRRTPALAFQVFFE